MKILVTATTFPRWKNDSEPPFVFFLNRFLLQYGHSIIILAPHYPGAKFHERMHGLEIYRFPYFFPLSLQKLCYEGGIVANMKKSLLAKVQAPLLCASEFFYMLYLCLKEKPDIIHAHWIVPQGIIGSIVSKLLNIPLVITAHGTDIYSFQKGLFKHLSHFALSSAKLITVNSSVGYDLLYKTHNLKNLKIIPMGVDTDRFNPSKKDLALKKDLNKSNPIILTTGRIVEQKGIHFLLDALPEIIKVSPELKLCIIGDGPYKAELEKRVTTLHMQNHVTFLGKIPNNELPRYYASSDVFIGPSVTLCTGETEGFGVVFLEAIASGLPVIASNVGGIPDIIENKKNGLLVNQKKATEIATAFKQLTQNKNLYRDITKNGLRDIEKKFSWNAVSKSFNNGYQNLSNQNSL